MFSSCTSMLSSSSSERHATSDHFSPVAAASVSLPSLGYEQGQFRILPTAVPFSKNFFFITVANLKFWLSRTSRSSPQTKFLHTPRFLLPGCRKRSRDGAKSLEKSVVLGLEPLAALNVTVAINTASLQKVTGR